MATQPKVDFAFSNLKLSEDLLAPLIGILGVAAAMILTGKNFYQKQRIYPIKKTKWCTGFYLLPKAFYVYPSFLNHCTCHALLYQPDTPSANR